MVSPLYCSGTQCTPFIVLNPQPPLILCSVRALSTYHAVVKGESPSASTLRLAEPERARSKNARPSNAEQKTQRPRSFSSAATKELDALKEETFQDPHLYTMKCRKGLTGCSASKCGASECKTHAEGEHTPAPHPYTMQCRTGLRGCCARQPSSRKRNSQRPRSMSARPSDLLSVEQKPQRPRSVSAWPAEQKTQRPRSLSSAALAELDAIKEETFQDPHSYTKKTRQGLTGCSASKCSAHM